MDVAFIADVHLGKLAKLLRMLGFNTAYSNAYTHTELATIALKEDRMLLSKNILLPKWYPAIHFLAISHNEPAMQLQQVLQQFHLFTQLQPFTRCIACNGMLEPAAKEIVLSRLPQNTGKYHDEFWQCLNCKHIYWKGPHYNRMRDFIEKLQQDN